MFGKHKCIICKFLKICEIMNCGVLTSDRSDAYDDVGLSFDLVVNVFYNVKYENASAYR